MILEPKKIKSVIDFTFSPLIYNKVMGLDAMILVVCLFVCFFNVAFQVNPKGIQPWIFIRRTGAEGEAPIFWLPDAKSWLTGQDPDAGKGWRQKEKGAAEDEMGI